MTSSPRRSLGRIAVEAGLAVGLVFATAHCSSSTTPALLRPSLHLEGARDGEVAPSGVSGVVVDAAGAPVAGATVLAIVGEHDDDPTPMVRTARDGSFHFDGLGMGTWRFSASSLLGTALGGEPVTLERADQHATLHFQLEPATHVLVGSVRDELGGSLRGVALALGEVSARPGAMFGVIADDDGDFQIGISTSHPYVVGATAPGRARVYALVPPDATSAPPMQLGATPAERPSDAVLARWLASEAKPISTVSPGLPVDDLDPLGRMIGSARIVALGEATHGSSDIQRLKHRIIEHLVERDGVTVFAMEAGMTESVAIDEHITRGQGSAMRALWGLHTFSWETHEMLELFDWLRYSNTKRTEKVRFEGFDVTSFSAVRALAEYLRVVDPGLAASFEDATKPLADPSSDGSYGGEDPAKQAVVRQALEHTGDRLGSRKKAYVAKSGAAAWDIAVRQLAAAKQAEAVFRDPLSRDAAMAANVDAMIARYPAGTRFVLWMHNSHASAEAGRVFDMGRILRETHGDDYFVLGFAFGRGSFRAFQAGDPKFEVRELSVGEPVAEGLDAALGLASAPLYAIDLRTAQGDVKEWLDSPLLAWNIGGRYADDRSARIRVRPGEAYDAMIYIDRLTATRPLPKRK
jgi:erythromycin esterase